MLLWRSLYLDTIRELILTNTLKVVRNTKSFSNRLSRTTLLSGLNITLLSTLKGKLLNPSSKLFILNKLRVKKLSNKLMPMQSGIGLNNNNNKPLLVNLKQELQSSKFKVLLLNRLKLQCLCLHLKLKDLGLTTLLKIQMLLTIQRNVFCMKERGEFCSKVSGSVRTFDIPRLLICLFPL